MRNKKQSFARDEPPWWRIDRIHLVRFSIYDGRSCLDHALFLLLPLIYTSIANNNLRIVVYLSTVVVLSENHSLFYFRKNCKELTQSRENQRCEKKIEFEKRRQIFRGLRDKKEKNVFWRPRFHNNIFYLIQLKPAQVPKRNCRSHTLFSVFFTWIHLKWAKKN